MRRKAFALAFLLALVLVAAKPQPKPILYDPRCSEWEPYSFYWFFEGCWWQN